MASRAQELAESILSLYDVSKPSDDVIAKYYLPDAAFSDPLVAVKGIENVQAQFRVLPKIIESSKITLIRGSMAGASVLTIDSSAVYHVRPFPSLIRIKMRIFSVIELKNGKVASHTDHWDFHSVLTNIPLFAFFYEQFRSLFGATSSALIKRMLPAIANTPANAEVPPTSNSKDTTNEAE